MAITILEGSTFCICDELGDVGGWPTSGFFTDDTRFLSILRLSINGRRPLLLSSGKVDYFSAAFYLRNQPVDGLAQDEVSVIRERFVGEAMQDRLVVQNQGMRPVAFELAIEVASDFADIFAVKDYDFAHSFGRSVSDLASLRMGGSDGGVGRLPAAGMPWFMTVFGRDTLITCLQTLLFGPELAVTALDALRERQSTVDDPVRDADGFLEYKKRSRRGLDNQSWKDSHDSQRFSDGRVADPPIAPCEVQGYVYDAKRRMAELAREVWRDRELADRLEREADELRRRFNEVFWIEERNGYYALALDGEHNRVDSLCSNIGHLLWSGIVPAERVDAVVDQLMGDALWSGWGVRTMSTEDQGYSPLAYHNGTVWPHDNSLIAWGLMRYGRWPEAYRIIRQMLTAGRYFDYQLPEVFAGLPRAETRFPIAYPTAARPQAWAAGTSVLLLQLLLGLQPDRRQSTLETIAPSELPAWAGSLRLSGVRAFDQPWEIRLEEGSIRVTAA